MISIAVTLVLLLALAGAARLLADLGCFDRLGADDPPADG